MRLVFGGRGLEREVRRGSGMLENLSFKIIFGGREVEKGIYLNFGFKF